MIDISSALSITNHNHTRYAPRRGTRPRRRNPPYAKQAAARLAAHSGPLTGVDVRLFTGCRAWVRASWWSSYSSTKVILCLPPSEDPAAYRWTIARGVEPWVIETGGNHETLLQRLALELLSAGARVVRVSFWDDSERPMVVFREIQRG